jgi:hypothetical protein
MAKYNELKVNTTRFNGSFPPPSIGIFLDPNCSTLSSFFTGVWKAWCLHGEAAEEECF